MTKESTDASVAPEPWSIRRLLLWAAEDFQKRGFEAPRLEAELLLGHALAKSRIELITQFDFVPEQQQLNMFRELVRRRRQQEPTAYLLGQREFYGLLMQVDPRVLIPRPDTETLVEVALQRSRQWYAHGQALDLCTGSGCIALAFLHQRPGWRMIGADISADALQVAERNALRLGKIVEVSWVKSDLFTALPKQRFDLITANPPYIPSAEVLCLQPTILDYEPRIALDGGTDGLDVTRRIVEQAPAWLTPGGALALEIGCDQGPIVEALLREGGFSEVMIHRDYGSRDRVVSGRFATESVPVAAAPARLPQ
jgi:release factor glutamine methyltransferase